jgi:ribosomal protein S18 acetylase RimI-like enzyme
MGPIVPTENEPQIPGARTSFAVRIYESAAGKGLATPYCRAIVQAHQILYGVGGEWLEAWGDNERALKPYRHVGFEEVARIPGNRHGEVVDRVYMTLGDISDY